MRISKIIINNFRIYQGKNTISFSPFSDKNINIISGKNGFGKTTLLTGLLWTFYGKLIGQVEDKYRLDIRNAGGYDAFLKSLYNRGAFANSSAESKHSFSIEVELQDLKIPALTCNTIKIKRSYNIDDNQEKLDILIDGIENELTKEVGYDLFINDFILPREIAKFFFFDAEKIVSLAEARTKEELRSLSKAYSEVLGIKKYEELKKNLESLITKLGRQDISDKERIQLEELIKKEKASASLLEYNIERQKETKEELANLKVKGNALQEKLIREGNSITVEELAALKKERNQLKKESAIIKSELNQVLELAPLVIAGDQLKKLKDQIEKEHTEEHVSSELLKKELNSFSKTILEKIKTAKVEEKSLISKIFKQSIAERFKEDATNTDILVAFTEEQYLDFQSLFKNLSTSYADQVKSIVQREKNNRVLLSRIQNEIKQSEARKDNHLAKTLHNEKRLIENQIAELKEKQTSLLIEQGQLEAKNNSDKKQVSELDKKFRLVDTDNKKLLTTKKLLDKINALITRIKEDKKYTLQKALKLSLNKLMHKSNFIADVKVHIDNEIMDIELLDERMQTIRKDSLSKGEQQLYATALLKALVDESGISFPVFIDSPLQKFDKFHSKSVIKEFYPSISDQVVLLPLLQKELNKEEFELLKPNLHKTFKIVNEDSNSSFIKEADFNKDFETLETESYV
ncbi:DNA sulfur modification protein DndD [Costertonia aggregata]|uniref:DNA sulfur modification protein DndD n=1 Tax=Costertonia aggregata TaxID=343403 RepID=A0A7H9AMR4_9FLAO|nr:DNA sulfur modification protein DndD [Costertonia aggregata]QLG44728.1 DNA sulfur modification protein DndD [Costertonia aggregata]